MVGCSAIVEMMSSSSDPWSQPCREDTVTDMGTLLLFGYHSDKAMIVIGFEVGWGRRRLKPNHVGGICGRRALCVNRWGLWVNRWGLWVSRWAVLQIPTSSTRLALPGNECMFFCFGLKNQEGVTSCAILNPAAFNFSFWSRKWDTLTLVTHACDPKMHEISLLIWQK